MKFKRVLLLIAALYISNFYCTGTAFSAQDNSSSLIKGFALYQAGRVENIILDSFISDLANEKYLKQFFPETSESISGYYDISGKRLIPLLKYYFNKDLEHLEKFSKCVRDRTEILNEKFYVNKREIEIKNSLETLDWLLVFKKNKSFTIEEFLTVICDVDASNKEVESIKNKFVREMIFFKIYESIKSSTNNIYEPEVIIKIISDKLESFVKEDERKSIFGVMTFGTFGVSGNEKVYKGIDFPGFMKAIQRITELEETKSKETRLKLYTIYVHQLVVALEALGFQVDDRKGFRKFKNASLFLASLVEAENLGNGDAPKAVAGVISDFVGEDEVYKNKRDTVALYTRRIDKSNLRCSTLIFCNNTWFVGSYYGFSAGYLDVDSDGTEQLEYRAFGPVGVEFKIFSGPFFGKNTTVTFMTAPFDIGVYITNELKGKDYDVNFDDISAPNYFFSFSSKESPMSLQVGFQKDIPIENNEKDNMWFIAFSYDLPLFTIW